MERILYYVTLNFNITLLLSFRLQRTFSDDNILYFYITGHEKKRHSCAQCIERTHKKKPAIVYHVICIRPHTRHTMIII